MSELKFCQGTKCHTYNTKDRLRGMKGNKTFQTRRRSSFYYGKGNFCSMNCYNDWFETFGDRAVDHFGRLREPKRVDCDNAWYKDYFYIRGQDYNSPTRYNHYLINDLLGQKISITEQQYNNTTTDNINQLVIQQNSKS